jgi:hypothetical protein
MRSRLKFAAAVLLCLASVSAVAQQWQWGRPRPPRAGACFYKDVGFNGDYFCMQAGDRWPSLPRGFNDRISSIRTFGGALVQLFDNEQFRGRHVRINRDVDSLLRLRLPEDPRKSWNDRVSAIAVYRPRDPWDQQHP